MKNNYKTETTKQKRSHIMIITGTPGVGKHTVAKAITQMTNDWQHIIDINESAYRAGLLDEYTDCNNNNNKQNNDKHNKSIEVDTDKLAHIIKQNIKVPKNYIIVGHLAPYVIQATDNVIFAAVLRRNPYDLIKVYKKRGYTHSKSRENAGAEILGIITHDTFLASYKRTGQFDTTEKNPRKVARMILDAMYATYHDNYNNSPKSIVDKNSAPWRSIDWLRDNDSKDNTSSVSKQTQRMLEDFFPNLPQGS